MIRTDEVVARVSEGSLELKTFLQRSEPGRANNTLHGAE